MKTKMVFIGMLLVAFSCAYGGAVYDYDNGNVTGSPTPGTAIAGQDGWVEITSGQAVRDDLSGWAGLSGLVAYVGGDSQASRLNDASFDFGIIGNNVILEYTALGSGSGGWTFTLGGDADGDGDIEGDEVGVQFGHHQTNSVGYYFRQAAMGSNVGSGVDAGGTAVRRIVAELDLAANGGDGSGTLLVQQLSDSSGNPIEDTLTAYVTNADLKLSRINDLVEAPANWTGLYTRMYGSAIDNLTVRGDGVVTAHAYAPIPDPWAHYDAQTFESPDAVLSWKTGRDSTDWTQINSDIVEHHVYMRDADSTDPNLYLTAIVSGGTDPISWDPSDADELQRGKTYQWCVVEAVAGHTGVSLGSDLADYDPNNIKAPIWSFKTEPAVPVITVQPETVITKNGDDAVFTLTATDPLGGTLSYEWRDPSDAVIGTDSPTLTIVAPTLADEGDYYCIVTNAQGSTTSNTAALTKGRLIGQWLVDGDPNDVSGNGNSATLFNSPALVSGPLPGTFGRDFDGSTQYATVTIDDVLNKYKDQLTIACWVRDNGASTWRRFLNYGYYNIDGADFARMDLCRNNWSTRTMAVRMGNKTGGTFETASMPQGEWNHFIAVYDGEGLSLFKNGELTSAPTAAGGPMRDVLGEPIVMGARIYVSGTPTAPSSHFKGSLSDVRVYNYGMDKWDAAGLFSSITGEDVCVEQPEYDLNDDCVVNMYEFSVLASEWMLDNLITP